MRMLTDSVPSVRDRDFDVAYLKARFFLAALYQPFKRLATFVTPRWGFTLQLVGIYAKLELNNLIKILKR